MRRQWEERSSQMRPDDVDPKELRGNVEADFLRYATQYQPSANADAIGVARSREKVDAEVEKMVRHVVDPYSVTYFSGDDQLPAADRRIGKRRAYVVAEDGNHVLLYDIEAEDFVLAHRKESGQLAAWGIRGDAASTFLAR
jgi:hypothetical protein